MAFFQTPPELPSPFASDTILKRFLKWKLPGDVLAKTTPLFERMGEFSASAYTKFLAGRNDEPTLTQWNAWGQRVDTIELTPLWREMAPVAAQSGLIAIPYEQEYGAWSRMVQMTLVYLFEPSSGVYSCPLAMTDGATKTLRTAGNKALMDRAVPRLTSRDPKAFWTSGQWMTERTGGSDVGISETIAKKEGEQYRLHGTKWFTSATTSEMALTLARPEGNPPGGSGLALFYVETRDSAGALNGIRINRLKDKLGTKMVPTAELSLEGALATPVVGLSDGTRNIAPMLGITRTWNAVCAVSGMRRSTSLAKDYAQKRVAFGKLLADKQLHVDTLARSVAETVAAFGLAFRTTELLGRSETGAVSAEEDELLRLLTPLAKLTTGKQAVSVVSESLESFGGAGYVEDTGLPRLLRDAQVLPIWEGTTNVLSLDVLRALGRNGDLTSIAHEVTRATKGAPASLGKLVERTARAIEHAQAWLNAARLDSLDAIEFGARRFALTLGRTLELAYLIEFATAASDMPAIHAAAELFATSETDFISDMSFDKSRALFAAI